MLVCTLLTGFVFLGVVTLAAVVLVVWAAVVFLGLVDSVVATVVSLTQIKPEPEYPPLQAQVKEPALLVHAALASQLWVPVLHSLMSVQGEPEYPVMQAHV
jgi:nucleoside recognition membrane protein YjiH